MGLPNKLSCEAEGSPTTSTPNMFFQSEILTLFHSARTVGCTVCLTPQLFLLVYPHTNVGPPPCPDSLPPPCCKSSPPRLWVSAPPTSLDECFLFNSLVVGLPYSLIFCQFWLVFVVVLLLVVQGGTVFLPTPPSWPGVHCFLFSNL